MQVNSYGISRLPTCENSSSHGSMEKFWNVNLDKKKLTVVEIINAVCEEKIKGMYVVGENPVMSDQIRIIL